MSWQTWRLATSSAEQTADLAAAVAGLARPGDLVVLGGELGAGKTAFAKGFARGLGITEAVTSPTFTIIREYAGGRLGLHHLDVYRLEHLREVVDLGLGEMLDEDAVMLVEWGDAVLPALPDQYLDIRIAFGEGDDDRTFEVSGRGGGWASRSRILDATISPWAESGTASC